LVINDADDNKPYLDQTSYVFCADQGATSGTLANVNADDNDVLAANKQLTYEFIGRFLEELSLYANI